MQTIQIKLLKISLACGLVFAYVPISHFKCYKPQSYGPVALAVEQSAIIRCHKRGVNGTGWGKSTGARPVCVVPHCRWFHSTAGGTPCHQLAEHLFWARGRVWKDELGRGGQSQGSDRFSTCLIHWIQSSVPGSRKPIMEVGTFLGGEGKKLLFPGENHQQLPSACRKHRFRTFSILLFTSEMSVSPNSQNIALIVLAAKAFRLTFLKYEILNISLSELQNSIRIVYIY